MLKQKMHAKLVAFLKDPHRPLRKYGKGTVTVTPRELKVIGLRLAGRTFEEIGEHFGVTAYRIQQIFAKAERKIDYDVEIRARETALEERRTKWRNEVRAGIRGKP